MKPLKPEKPKPDKTRPLDFESSVARDEYMRENADYFTVVRYLGPGKGYERHECPTVEVAMSLARRIADEAGKAYLIYAVSGIHDGYVTTVHPKGGPIGQGDSR